MSERTLFRGKRQALINVGQVLGPKKFEADPLAEWLTNSRTSRAANVDTAH
jgi:hypothetical protein